MLSSKVGSTLFVNGYKYVLVKLGQSAKSIVFTAVSSTSVKVGMCEMPSKSCNLRRFGLTESDLGYPNAESMMRFPEFGS